MAKKKEQKEKKNNIDQTKENAKKASEKNLQSDAKAKKDKKPLTEMEQTDKKESFFKSTAFMLIISIVAFAGIVGLMLGIAIASGSTLGGLLGNPVQQVDYHNDSLDKYIDIKESDYKGIEVNIPIKGPTAKDVDLEVQRLIATYRKGPKYTSETWSLKEPVKIGDDAYVYYVAYTLDDDGRKLVIKEASNHKSGTEYRYTVGTGSRVFGVGFDEALVGKTPIEGGIGEIRETAYATNGCVVYATVSYVMDNGLLYNDVNVCVDPLSPDFESLWGVGAEELFYNDMIIDSNVLTGESFETYELAGGGKITYTALTVNYVTKSQNAPYTIESTFSYDYGVEELRGKTVLFDVYLEKTVVYNTYEFDDDFVTNKIGAADMKYNAEIFKDYDGETATEKYKSFIKKSLDTSYDNYCRSYAEKTIWDYIKSNAVVKEYPKTEVDNLYISWERYYQEQLAKENAAGAGYEDFDEYMAEIFELGERGEWTSVLLAQVKETVKERLIVYAVLRDAGILPGEEEYKKIYEEELLRDFNYANALAPGRFESIDDYREYIEEDLDYEHSVYFYYVTDKLVEMANLKYPQ